MKKEEIEYLKKLEKESERDITFTFTYLDIFIAYLAKDELERKLESEPEKIPEEVKKQLKKLYNERFYQKKKQ